MERAPTTVVCISRLIAALGLAVTLLAMPAFNPEDASARKMSERTAIKRCLAAGGSIHHDWTDADDPMTWGMTCSLPSGEAFVCIDGSGVFANIVDCA